jgi:hypothetical protein
MSIHQEVYGRQAAAAIMGKIEGVIAGIPREQRAQFALWHRDEEKLIEDDIQYGNFMGQEDFQTYSGKPPLFPSIRYITSSVSTVYRTN